MTSPLIGQINKTINNTVEIDPNKTISSFDCKVLGSHIDELIVKYDDNSYDEITNNFCPSNANIINVKVPKDNIVVGLYGTTRTKK